MQLTIFVEIMKPLELYCPVCRNLFNWWRGYGREIRCCCKECHEEADWRRTLAILGKEYYPEVKNEKS